MISAAVIDRLKAQLLTSGLSQKDAATFQVINQLIDAVREALVVTVAAPSSGSGGGAPTTATYLTETNETGTLFNSRRLLAGTDIILDVSVPGEMTINAVTGSFIDWSVLTNGDAVNPELIFAGGDVIMLHTP